MKTSQMKASNIALSELKYRPDNYRIISERQLGRLAKSLREFPEMLKARPILVDKKTNEILAGEMRVRALKHLGRKELEPGEYKFVEGLTKKQKTALSTKDNLHQGQFDHDALEAFETDTEKLKEFGLPEHLFLDDAMAEFEDEFEDLDEKMDNFKNQVKRALQVPVEPNRYVELVTGLNALRRRGLDVGKLFIDKLHERLTT